VLAAVDLAMPGDSVLVGPGIWTDTATRNVTTEYGTFLVTACAFPRGGVVIRGEGAAVTVLDAGGEVSQYLAAVEFAQRRGEGVLRLESMRLTGAYGPNVTNAVVGITSDGIELRSCRLEGNDNSSGAALAMGECPLTMVDCEVVGNTSPGAVVRVDDTSVHLMGCRFEGNVGRCVQTNYDAVSFLPVLIQDCEFVRNRGTSSVCLNLQQVFGFVVERCLFLENVAETGTGAGIRTNGSSGEIRFNVFAYDSCYGSASRGGGIRAESSQTSILNNTFVGCYSGLGGAAFSADLGVVSAFRGNLVAHSRRGPAVNASASTTVLGNTCNLYWDNAGGNFGIWTPSATDIIADPLFCALAALDFTVRDDSPCLDPPTPSCAPIGALGAGCGGVSVEPTSFGRIKAMYR
jgi:hypothetical protein